MAHQDYRRCVAFLIDGPKPQPSGRRRQAPNLHRDKYDEMRTFFREKTDFEVREIVIPINATPKNLLSTLDAEISLLSRGDLAVVYFFGNAGPAPYTSIYSWRLKGNPNGWVNACTIMEKFTQATDCLFILDCFIPTNWAENKKLARPTGQVAEIISSRGIEQKDPDGNLAFDIERDFTFCLVATLEKRVDEAKTTFKKHKGLRTIPQAMQPDQEIMDHPDRIAAFRGGKSLGFVRLDPEDIRITGKMRFFPPSKSATTSNTTHKPLGTTNLYFEVLVPAPTPAPPDRKRNASLISADDEGYKSDSSASGLSKKPRRP